MPILWCKGNPCIYCGNWRDWDYDEGVDWGNNAGRIFDKRRWSRAPDAECFFGDEHFPPFYHRDDDSTHNNESARFFKRFVRNPDLPPNLSDDTVCLFYTHFTNICECV